MNRFLLGTILLGLIPSANAGVYYYPAFQKGIVVNCANGVADHIVEFKAVSEVEDCCSNQAIDGDISDITANIFLVLYMLK